VFALTAYSRQQRSLDAMTAFLLVGAFGIMTWSLATRWQIAGRIPASNMYESMLFLGWGVGLFAVFAALLLRNRLLVLNATFMSAICMALLDLLPMDGFIHPMPPVLTGTPWLAIHVPITMVSYSVFAIGALIAHAQIASALVAPDNHQLARKLNQLLYLYMHIGSILLAAGILTGSIWAASSWGRYWGWDPKEVWSLIALLAYMAILHGRFDRMIGAFGTAALSIIAFSTILMTYLGVNFILSAGLHSYGFGESSVARWLLLYALIEAVFLIVATVIHFRRQPAVAPATAS
jgi:cytochrome c-type biogenesis protein CcsB